VIQSSEVDEREKYWAVYLTAVAAISRDVAKTRRKLPRNRRRDSGWPRGDVHENSHEGRCQPTKSKGQS